MLGWEGYESSVAVARSRVPAFCLGLGTKGPPHLQVPCQRSSVTSDATISCGCDRDRGSRTAQDRHWSIRNLGRAHGAPPPVFVVGQLWEMWLCNWVFPWLLVLVMSSHLDPIAALCLLQALLLLTHQEGGRKSLALSTTYYLVGTCQTSNIPGHVRRTTCGVG